MATRKIIGWREWLCLPGLNIRKIKVKVDTGARSSALHAENVEFVRHKGVERVRFIIFPLQKNKTKHVWAEADLVDFRAVRSSSGHHEIRPVIVTGVRLLDRTWPIEITLTQRDIMGFRMLLGRQAVKGLFLVDPGRSFLAKAPG